MKLSDLIRDFRKRTNISQREFSRRCDLSNTYISFLENEKNPKTDRPIIPTLEQYKKLADGMEITVQNLFEQLDEDAPVDIRDIVFRNENSVPVFIPDSKKFTAVMKHMSFEDYKTVIDAFNRTYEKMKQKGIDI